MALISRVPAHEAAAAAARAMEELLGHDVMLGVGEAVITDAPGTLMPGGGTRSVALPFDDGAVGEVTLVATDRFAASMESVTSDASLVTAALPVLHAAVEVTGPAVGLRAAPEYTTEIATETLTAGAAGDFSVAQITEGDECVACIVTRIVAADPAALIGRVPAPEPLPAPAVADDAVTPVVVAAAPAAPMAPAAPVGAGVGAGVVGYQFQQLRDGSGVLGAPRPISLLNDVRMEVVAELGSRRMKVRDLVALAPGSVIQLDRTAGSPVDVLVNGALLARAEVVVIDEEFGIRVSEIIVGES